ncbi:MAG TPA: hypothetical protein VI112_10500 [Bacteroidia bacterium]|jgi:hypothetical protein
MNKTLFFPVLVFISLSVKAQKLAPCHDSIPPQGRYGYPHDFGIFSNCKFGKAWISIYDRWGQKLFESDSSYKGGPITWDFNKVSNGEVVMYYASFTFEGDKTEYQAKNRIEVIDKKETR